MSHAWSYPFADLLAALEAHAEQDTEMAYFWVGASSCACLAEQPADAATPADLFVANQHSTTQRPQEWWSGEFRESVVDIGCTVLVLQPWDAPVPLTRSWCLWEIFNTLDGGAELQIALSPAQRAAFQVALVSAGL